MLVVVVIELVVVIFAGGVGEMTVSRMAMINWK